MHLKNKILSKNLMLDKTDRGEIISFPIVGSFEVTYMNKVETKIKLLKSLS